jgi:hypothetical protein
MLLFGVGSGIRGSGVHLIAVPIFGFPLVPAKPTGPSVGKIFYSIGEAIPTGEYSAFLGDLINVRGRMAEVRAATVAPEVAPAGVVGHEHDDVRFLVRRLCRVDWE